MFAAAPYGVVGAVAALWIMDTPFGFMAFLGVAILIGVIVSHVIVLFDFIEEKHEEAEPFEEAVIDAGIIRLRPVMITVGATVLALFPLALHGGALWQPLCYTQIGGLVVATFITLLLVPVLYAIFVMDLKILKWETKEEQPPLESQVMDIVSAPQWPPPGELNRNFITPRPMHETEESTVRLNGIGVVRPQTQLLARERNLREGLCIRAIHPGAVESSYSPMESK